MSWKKLAGILGALIIWAAAPALAADIDKATDSQGTIHITTPKPAQGGEAAAVKPVGEAGETACNRGFKPSENPDQPPHLDYKSRPLSCRPMHYQGVPGAPGKVRPSPYSQPSPGPAPGAPAPEGVNQDMGR